MFKITYQDSRSASGIGTAVTSDVNAFAARWGMEVLSVVDIAATPADALVSGNCLYGGNAVGHSHGFCTADSCY